jgi:hypothetical protein
LIFGARHPKTAAAIGLCLFYSDDAALSDARFEFAMGGLLATRGAVVRKGPECSVRDLGSLTATHNLLPFRRVEVVQLPAVWTEHRERVIANNGSNLLRVSDQDQVSVERSDLFACWTLNFGDRKIMQGLVVRLRRVQPGQVCAEML